MHSMAFRACSMITWRHSCTLICIWGLFNSHTKALFLVVTPQWVEFNNDSMMFTWTQWVFTLSQWHSCALYGVQRLFTLTHWYACTLNGFSGAVHNHSKSKASMQSQYHSRGVQYSLKGIQPVHKSKAQWICFKSCDACEGPVNLLLIFIECSSIFLFLSFAKQEEWEIMRSNLNTWLVGCLGVCE